MLIDPSSIQTVSNFIPSLLKFYGVSNFEVSEKDSLVYVSELQWAAHHVERC